MIPLPIAFRSDGFDFSQIAREGILAIYRKSKTYQSGFSFETFEVVRIQKMDDHQWPDGRIQLAHEHMPHSEQWGVNGFSLQSSNDAWNKFRQLLPLNA
jgi:hypothetical protein